MRKGTSILQQLTTGWQSTGQFTIVEGHYNRRADVILSLNGLPLVVIELQEPRGCGDNHMERLQSAPDLCSDPGAV